MKIIIQSIRKLICIIGLVAISITSQAQVLDLESTTEGALLPRMTTAQRTAITSATLSPSEIVYDTDTKSFWYWEDMQWNELGAGGAPMPTMTYFECGVGISGDTLSNTLPAVRDTITLTSSEMITAETHISICLDIDHTFAGDLDISLISPNSAVTLDLTSDNGFFGDNFKGTCFSATAKESITSISPLDAPFTGVYQPEQAFTGLIGETIAGDWTLEIVDDGFGDEGILNYWEINITNSFSIIAQKALFTDRASIADTADVAITTIYSDTTEVLSDGDRDTRITVTELDHIKMFLNDTEKIRLVDITNNGVATLNFRNNNLNTLIGFNAGSDIDTTGGGDNGKANTVIGFFAGNGLIAGHDNVMIGSSAGDRATGSNNTFLGSSSGFNSTGSGNVFLGTSAGANELTGNNKLYIENSNSNTPLIYGEFDNDILKFNGSIEADFHVKNASAFFGEDSGGLPSSFGKGVRVYHEIPSNTGRIFAYDYSAGSPLDMTIQATGGRVAIGGDFATGYELSVNGEIACEEVLVDLVADWPDYVFESDYKLRSLEEVQQYIDERGHLPNVPSAEEVADNGIEIGEMNRILMEKVEELTLYLIDQEIRMKAQDKKMAELANRLSQIEQK